MYIFLGLQFMSGITGGTVEIDAKKVEAYEAKGGHTESKCNRCSTIVAYDHNADSKHPAQLKLEVRSQLQILNERQVPALKIPPDPEIQLTHSKVNRTQIMWSSLNPYLIPYRIMQREALKKNAYTINQEARQ